MKRIQDMTMTELKAVPRDKMLEELYKMAKEISVKYDYEKYRKMWTMCCDWNSEHYGGVYDEAEIFMCEDVDGEGNDVFYIEDDYFHYGD